MSKIGFVGLGEMGGPMAANLVMAGHDVTATDLSIGAIDRAVSAGCRRGDTVAKTVDAADVVITRLPGAAHMQSVYLDSYGVLAHAKKGALFIDTSAIDVETARLVARAAREAGFEMVDAPACGDHAAACKRTLKFFVGGEQGAFGRARPILEAIGDAVSYVGLAGAGQAATRDETARSQAP